MSQIAIEPIGPFSWPAAIDVLNHFQPMQRHSSGAPDVIRMSFPLDREFTPVAVALRFQDGALRGQVAGTSNLDAVSRQIAQVFSLDVERLTERFKPFRMWVCFLLRVAAGRGVIDGIAEREGTIPRQASRVKTVPQRRPTFGGSIVWRLDDAAVSSVR